MNTIRYLRITAPHFIAGADVRNGRVVRAAPILHYMLGWSVDNLNEYCRRKKWLLEYTYADACPQPTPVG